MYRAVNKRKDKMQTFSDGPLDCTVVLSKQVLTEESRMQRHLWWPYRFFTLPKA